MKRRQFMKHATVAGAAAGLVAQTAYARKPAMFNRTVDRSYIRVGMVGTGPYSHAMAYTQAINEPTVPPRTDMKVVAVWGKEDGYRSSLRGSDEFVQKRMNELKSYHSIDKYTNELGVEHVARRPEDMVRLVDAAFIMDPEDALNLARPFIEASKPIFVNRPFAWTMREARELLKLAEANDVPVISGSCIPWMNEFQVAKSRIDRTKLQHYYTDGSTANFCSYMPHILETAQMLVGGKVVRCSTHGMTWAADEDPLSIPPVMTHVEYEKVGDRNPVLGVASTWYGQPYRNWMKVHLDRDVIEQGVYWEGGNSSQVEKDEHLWMPLLREVSRTFETGVSPDDDENILQKVATMLMAHKSGALGGQPVGIDEIENHVLPRFETEKA